MAEEQNENEPTGIDEEATNIEAADDELLATAAADADSNAEQDTVEQGTQTSDSLDALVEQVAKEQATKQWSSREKILAGVSAEKIKESLEVRLQAAYLDKLGLVD